MSAGLIALLSDIPVPSTLSSSEISRVRAYLDRLRARVGAEELIASWLHNRAERIVLRAPQHNLIPLLTDPRISVSGVSDPRISVTSPVRVEGYVTDESRAELTTHYRLMASSRPNVVLHVVRQQIPTPVPLALSIADLAEHQSRDLGPAFGALLLRGLMAADATRRRQRKNSDFGTNY